MSKEKIDFIKKKNENIFNFIGIAYSIYYKCLFNKAVII